MNRLTKKIINQLINDKLQWLITLSWTVWGRMTSGRTRPTKQTVINLEDKSGTAVCHTCTVCSTADAFPCWGSILCGPAARLTCAVCRILRMGGCSGCSGETASSHAWAGICVKATQSAVWKTSAVYCSTTVTPRTRARTHTPTHTHTRTAHIFIQHHWHTGLLFTLWLLITLFTVCWKQVSLFNCCCWGIYSVIKMLDEMLKLLIMTLNIFWFTEIKLDPRDKDSQKTAIKLPRRQHKLFK